MAERFRAFVRHFPERLMACRHYAMTLAAAGFRPEGLARVRVPNVGIRNVIRVDPNRIDFYCSVPVKPRRGSRFFIGGDWDVPKLPMAEVETDNPKFVTCRQLLVEHLAPEETAEFKMLVGVLDSRGGYRGCGSREEIRNYVENLARMYAGIRDRGYLPRAHFGGTRYSGEIECALDRDGNLIKINAGNHRFAAARILGLKSVPVQLCFVHEAHFPAVARAAGEGTFLARLNAFIGTVERRYS